MPVLLVFGGSKGARSLNHALMAHLPNLLNEMQIIHLSGHLDWPEVQKTQQELIAKHQNRYRVFPYLHERMGAALKIADLVLSRAGASVLGEFPAFGLPAILVPYPHAWRYQRINARFLAEHGAALIVDDEDLPQRILPLVRDLMSDDSRRREMSVAMKKLDSPHAADKIAEILARIGKKSGGLNL